MMIGSLFSGYGGLELGVQAALGGQVAWHAEVDPGARAVLAHRWPAVPNLGDVTLVDWADLQPVDLMCGGFPCQPVSHAGKRLGDQDERWLWDDFARAIGTLRPRLVVLENVRGLLSAERGQLFGRVLGDLADVGYDAIWHGLRAAAVGAPHSRFRIFVVACHSTTANTEPVPPRQHGDTHRMDNPSARGAGTDRHKTQPSTTRGGIVNPPRTPAIPGWTGADVLGAEGGLTCGSASSVETTTDPTPSAATASSLSPNPSPGVSPQDWGGAPAITSSSVRTSPLTLDGAEAWGRRTETRIEWGPFAAAIARWESVTGRRAPPPTEPSRRRSERLSAVFVEWLMGLPAGWVTDVPGVSRASQLKCLGNGVVPQQAAAAITTCLRILAHPEAAA